MASTSKVPQKLKPWIEARSNHRLSHLHVQMARELGMNPKQLGKLDDRGDEPLKVPLPQFIEQLYARRFRRPRPLTVRTIEDVVAYHTEKSDARKAAKAARRLSDAQSTVAEKVAESRGRRRP